jgi:uncharacterized membrane protein YdjX (TVP38/TMEM64 family)
MAQVLRQFFQQQLAHAMSHGTPAAYGVYLALGVVRGFTLIPSTTLVVAALPFFPPGPLLLCTIAGIAVSSSSIYFFSSALRLTERLARKHPE